MILHITDEKLLGIPKLHLHALSHHSMQVRTLDSCHNAAPTSTCSERRHVVSDCAHTLRTLRSHSVINTTLQIVFKSVVVAKLVKDPDRWPILHLFTLPVHILYVSV